METGRRKIISGTIALLWFLAIFILYYVSHKPFTPDVLLALGALIWRLLVVGAVVSAAGVIGSWIYTGEGQHPLTRMAVQAALGLGLIAIMTLVTGSLIGINWISGAAVFVVCAVFFGRCVRWWKNWQALGQIWQESDGLSRFLATLVGILLLCAGIVALAPPLWFDSLSTHLLLPQAYLNDGKINYLPWQVMSGMPQNAEMLFALVMTLADGQTATTLGWVIGVLAVAGILGYLYQRLGVRPAWAGVAALLGGYSTVMLTASGYVEWLALLFGLGTLVLLDEWRQNGNRKSLWLAGVFTGLAIGTKYTAGILAIAGLCAVTWHIWKRKERLIPAGLAFGLGAIAASLPWFIKNWLTTGNPVYPFFFGGGAMTDLRMQVWQNVPVFGNWLDIVFLPIRATYLGMEGVGGYMVALGPLLLGLGGLAWLDRGRRSDDQNAALENAAVVALVGILVWALGNQYSGRLIQTRYYFSLFPAFAVLSGYGFWGVSRLNFAGLRLGRIVGVFVALTLIFNAIQVSTQTIRQDALRAAVGLRSEADYVADNLGWYQRAMWGIRELPKDSQVLLLYEARGYYCAPRCVADEVLDRWKGDLDTYQTYDAVIRAWQDQGFTHVMAYTAGMEFLQTAGDPNHPPEDMNRLDELLAGLPESTTFGGAYTLYTLP